jgi:hypothetical protein
MHDVANGQSRSRANAASSTWTIWCDFCRSLAMDPAALNVPDPIALLQVFAHQYRTGALPLSHAQVHSPMVGDALHAVGQTLAHLGHPDPHLTTSGASNLRLQRLLAAYVRSDPPPSRVKPVPLTLLHHVCSQHKLDVHPLGPVTADMITIAFFFLLHPGEYAKTDNPDSMPFCLCDVHL